ncbi:tafazzin-like isoform X2 [Acanthaster planci]|uniref:Tafazzin family protein n=1 Tax=Acanthaster planci TaxID=133434 RepID=A0A8B7Z2E1_ACAPL|nr:tafazzin-like isoform X2 [Acanthaster planci]
MPLEPWQFVIPEKPGTFWRIGSRFMIIGTGIISRIYLNWANHFQGHNLDILYNAVEKRPPERPLITVGNHISCFDPMLWGTLKMKGLGHPHKTRWCPIASDITCTKKWHVYFFSLGQGIPVVRGDGVYQHPMDVCIDKLHKGHWVHFFPEGKVNMNKEFMRLKWGVGRAIAESRVLPLVIPFWHLGMDEVLANHQPYIPKFGKKITMLIGKPLDFREALQHLREEGKSPLEIRKKLTDIIQEEFVVLKAKAEALHKARFTSST